MDVNDNKQEYESAIEVLQSEIEKASVPLELESFTYTVLAHAQRVKKSTVFQKSSNVLLKYI